MECVAGQSRRALLLPWPFVRGTASHGPGHVWLLEPRCPPSLCVQVRRGLVPASVHHRPLLPKVRAHCRRWHPAGAFLPRASNPAAAVPAWRLIDFFILSGLSQLRRRQELPGGLGCLLWCWRVPRKPVQHELHKVGELICCSVLNVTPFLFAFADIMSRYFLPLSQLHWRQIPRRHGTV